MPSSKKTPRHPTTSTTSSSTSSAAPTTNEEVAEFRNLFDLVQKKSGTDEIDREELGSLMKTIGVEAMSDKELDKIMEVVDEDGSGLIDFSEFLMVMGQQHGQTFFFSFFFPKFEKRLMCSKKYALDNWNE